MYSRRVNEYIERYRSRIEPLLPYDLQVEEIVDELSEADPTSNNRYLEWIIKQFISEEVLIEDVEQVRIDLEQFLSNAKRIPIESRDINKFTYSTLKDFLDDNFNPKIDYTYDVGDDGLRSASLRVLYDGPLGILSVPLTKESSCELGRGTRWCTSARGERNMFDYYNEKGPLYVFIDRQRGGEKIQLHLETSSIMNSRDNRLSDDLIEHYRTVNPVTSPIFKAYEESIIEDPSKSFEYAKNVVGGRWLPGENTIARSDIACKYARDIVEGRWPEAEEHISKDKYGSYCYAKDVVGGRWPEGEGVIAKDHDISYLYARDVVRGRWLEGEGAISKNPSSSFSYAAGILRERWFKGEYAILESPPLAYRYAKDVIKGRWDEAEEVILSRDNSQEERSHLAYMYAKDVVKGRWLEAEDDIMKDPHSSYMYAVFVIRGRWPEAEDIILNSEYEKGYRDNILSGRTIEPIFSRREL